MNIFISQSSRLGHAKAYLLREMLSKAAQNAGHRIVDAADAELTLIIGDELPDSVQLNGKKVALINAEQAFNSPENAVAEAQTNAADYVQPAKSAVSFENISDVKNIVAVTACPTGVAHTFLSAEAIEVYAKKQGWNVKVETRGQVGAGNPITPEEVAAADLVFVAADIDVDLSKFAGKPMYRTSTGLALKKTAQEFEKAFAEAKVYRGEQVSAKAETASDEKKGVYKHLMSGVSHMLPFVVAGGLLIAIAWILGGIYAGSEDNTGTLSFTLNQIGGTAFGLMIAAFAGYVAYSIADRPGLAVGFVGGMLANNAGAGILGGIFAGFLAGYVVKFLNDKLKLPATFSSLKPILILPLLGVAVVGLIMIYIINPPVQGIMQWLVNWLTNMGQGNAVLLGGVLGAMMCVDMGGPVNKAAYLFGTGLLASGAGAASSAAYIPMAAVMAAGMVPPIGMTVATLLARNKFTVNQRDAGKASFVLGLCFISEGALPFVAADPVRVIVSSILGGATAGAISSAFGVELNAPHGGLFVIPAVSQPLVYLAAIAVGAAVTGVVYAAIKQKTAE